MIQSWENLVTDRQTNESDFIGRCPTNVERPKIIKSLPGRHTVCRVFGLFFSDNFLILILKASINSFQIFNATWNHFLFFCFQMTLRIWAIIHCIYRCGGKSACWSLNTFMHNVENWPNIMYQRLKLYDDSGFRGNTLLRALQTPPT